MSTRIYVAYHGTQQIIVEATCPTSAQTLAAEKLCLRPSMAHYVVVRPMAKNIHRQRLMGAQA